MANRAIAQAFTASFPALQTQPETRDRNHNVDLPKWGSSTYLDKQYCLSDLEDSSAMAVTRIIANLSAPDPMALAKFYAKVFELDLPFDMGWIAFLNKETTQKIELHTASEGGSGTELPVISIGVEDLDATEVAVRAAGAEVVYGPVTESWGLRRFFFRDPAGNLVNVVDS